MNFPYISDNPILWNILFFCKYVLIRKKYNLTSAKFYLKEFYHWVNLSYFSSVQFDNKYEKYYLKFNLLNKLKIALDNFSNFLYVAQ